MNTQAGTRTDKNAFAARPRREKSMMDRSLEYARLHKGGKGLTVTELSNKFGEHEVTVGKLIRLGEAPKSILSLIKKGEVPATTVSNLIKASMSEQEIISVVNQEVKRRRKIQDELEEAGYKGASSLTLRRAMKLAITNLKERHLIKGPGQKAVVKAFMALVEGDSKPSVKDIENVVLMN